MAQLQAFIVANWTWLAPLLPLLLQEVIAASPLKSNSLGQLLLAVLGKLFPKPPAQ